MTLASKQRNSAMEILRIISTIFIICYHLATHGLVELWEFDLNFDSFNFIVSHIGLTGVVLFVMLSGYFLINSSFKVKKVVQLILQVSFYSLAIYALCLLTGIESFDIENAITAVFPTLNELYWFFTAYILLYIFSPFINKLLNSISKKQHLIFLITALTIWFILPTFTGINVCSSPLIQFVTIYSIGAYLRKYPENILSKRKNAMIISIITFAFLIVATIIILYLNRYSSGLGFKAKYLFNRNSIFIVLLASCLMVIFSKIKPFESKALNLISSCCFGVYLIHDNRFFRSFMWIDIFKSTTYFFSPFVWAYSIVCATVIFIACSIIELLRKKLVEKPTMKLYDLIEFKIKNKLKSK